MLLSRTLKCSTIAAEVLNVRVRDGNGCDALAISTEKTRLSRCDRIKNIKKEELGRIQKIRFVTISNLIITAKLAVLIKKVVKPHGLLVLVT